VNFTKNKKNTSDIVRAVHNFNISAFDFFSGGRFNPISAIKLGLWAKKNNVRILHSHGYKSDAIALIASHICRCKVITTPHGWSLEKDLKLKLYEKFDRFLFRFMDKILPLSHQLYFDLIYNKKLAIKTKLILNAVDIIEIDSIYKSHRSDYNIFLIGYIGQLVERKNLSLLLKAIKLLSKKKDNFKLLLIGDGKLRASLEEEVIRLGIASYIHFKGFKKNVLSLLKSIDLLVLPSLKEGIPRCIMEAMAAKVPVVASDIPGNKELITHGETGLLFDPYNITELVKNIAYIMDNKKNTNVIANKARKRIEDKYSNFRMAEEYIQLYNSLLNKT